MSGLRVAFVTGNYNAVVDGVALSSQRQVKALLDDGNDVRIYAPTAKKALIVPHYGDLVSVPSLPIVPPYRLALGLPMSIKNDILKFRPNIFHVASPDWLGLSALEFSKRRRIPCVSTFHTHFAHYARYYNVGFLEKPCWWLMRHIYSRSRNRAVFVACQSMVDELKSNGVDVNFEIVPFGVDAERFQPGKRSEKIREEWGFQPNDVVAIFVGRLVWEKGLKVFAETVNQLSKKYPQFKAVIVGDGPARGGFEKLLPQGKFLGRLTGEMLPIAFASSDLFLFPSASETFGLVSLEALASGLPAVVANATGSKDIVTHDHDGFICKPDNTPSFISACEKLITDVSLRKQFSEAAPQKATGQSWPVVMKKFVSTISHYALRNREEIQPTSAL